MSRTQLDDVDRGILHLLQKDARNNTTAEIADEVGVSASTVGNRIKKMEDNGVIDGYHPKINYERANLPLHIMFICTAPVAKQKDLATQTLDVFGVVNVREMLRGTRNVHVEAVHWDMNELANTTQSLDELGLEIDSSEILLRESVRPFNHFGSDRVDE